MCGEHVAVEVPLSGHPVVDMEVVGVGGRGLGGELGEGVVPQEGGEQLLGGPRAFTPAPVDARSPAGCDGLGIIPHQAFPPTSGGRAGGGVGMGCSLLFLLWKCGWPCCPLFW